MTWEQPSHRLFFGISALLFAGSSILTTQLCRSMSAMGEMPMAGGWTMSMAWMRMPTQTWLSAAASFLFMWVIMMAAMMLPSLLPMLYRYREVIARTGETRLERLTVLVTTGYFVTWAALGIAVFLLGVALTEIAMRHPSLARAVPLLASVVIVIAGAFQFTAWKLHHLARCRWSSPADCTGLSPRAGAAWKHGVQLGLHCIRCSAGLTAILLVIGVMDLRAMALVSAAGTLERFASDGEGAARAIGVLAIGTGLFLLARTVGLP